MGDDYTMPVPEEEYSAEEVVQIITLYEEIAVALRKLGPHIALNVIDSANAVLSGCIEGDMRERYEIYCSRRSFEEFERFVTTRCTPLTCGR